LARSDQSKREESDHKINSNLHREAIEQRERDTGSCWLTLNGCSYCSIVIGFSGGGAGSGWWLLWVRMLRDIVFVVHAIQKRMLEKY
jgi:hypothetical protein